jgi:TrmH family RNA methyltransferase
MLFVITSTQNEFIKMARSLKDKKGRLAYGAFLVEGEKCVSELISYNPRALRALIVTADSNKDYFQQVQKLGRPVYTVDTHVMKSVCDCKTPQNVAAVADIPAPLDIRGGLIVALDDLQDPANVGSIIRTADAAGCGGVVLSPDSADPYAPKAVRASMGSLFHLPVIRTELSVYFKKLLDKRYDIAAAHLQGNIEFSLDFSHTCLVIGNESRGISKELISLSTACIRIPIYGKAESLNAAVAAGILIYKIRS